MDMDLVALRRQWRHQEASAALAKEGYRRAVLKADRDGDPVAALAEAARAGDAESVRILLLNCLAWVNSPGQDGRTSLHWAAEGGDPEVVSRLLAAGASVRAKDEYGRTPLHWAAYNNALAAIRVLLAAGADVNAEANGGAVPLDKALDPECREVLAEAMASADLTE
jgi:ankyrin repeat protein